MDNTNNINYTAKDYSIETNNDQSKYLSPICFPSLNPNNQFLIKDRNYFQFMMSSPMNSSRKQQQPQQQQPQLLASNLNLNVSHSTRPIVNNSIDQFADINFIRDQSCAATTFLKSTNTINYDQSSPFAQQAGLIKTFNEHADIDKSQLYPMREFPLAFNPRDTANMSHKEKVNSWINDVPLWFLGNNGSNGFIWHNECYPGIIPTTCSSISDVDDVGFFSVDDRQHSEFIDSGNFDDHDGTGYGYDDELLYDNLFVDTDDIQEYQAVKITKYVNKLYRLDQSERVVRGHDTLLQYLNFEDGTKTNKTSSRSHRHHHNVDSQPAITNITNNGSYNFNYTDGFVEQLNSNSKKHFEEIDQFVSQYNNVDPSKTRPIHVTLNHKRPGTFD